MSAGTVAIILGTIALIALSAFFVAVEFALIGSKRHRLEEAAEGKENTTSAQSWIDAVQQIYTAANSMGELMRALHEEQGEHGPDVVARAEELVREVDQRE